MAIKKVRIGFIGSGNMAQAMIKGIVNSSLASQVKIFAYDVSAGMLDKACALGASPAEDSVTLACESDVIVLAVKPQVIAEALAVLPAKCMDGKMIISIAAGIKIDRIHRLLSKKAPVVRVMPNTPALVGEGACAYSVSKEVKKDKEELAAKILGTFCKVCIKVKEPELDAVTALSGSGPAYFFYFAEAMLEAASAMKFDKKTAKKLIIQTMTGAAKLMESTQEEPSALRAKVTSKGGTTERAIEGMENSGLKEVICKAVIAAKKRAGELGK